MGKSYRRTKTTAHKLPDVHVFLIKLLMFSETSCMLQNLLQMIMIFHIA